MGEGKSCCTNRDAAKPSLAEKLPAKPPMSSAACHAQALPSPAPAKGMVGMEEWCTGMGTPY